jgi:hypothetical protein
MLLPVVAMPLVLLGCQSREEKVTRSIKSEISHRFKDPGSVRFRNVHLFRKATRQGDQLAVASYSLCGTFNTKDSSGDRRFSSIWFVGDGGRFKVGPDSLFINLEHADDGPKAREKFEGYYRSDCQDETIDLYQPYPGPALKIGMLEIER